MRYAIFENGSHQYRVSEGDRLKLDLLGEEPGSEVVFDRILLVAGDGTPAIGTPLVAGARVTAQVVEHGRDKKILIQKFRRRKNYRRKRGHRQPFTVVRITGVAGPA